MKHLLLAISLLITLPACYQGHWDGSKPVSEMEKWAKDGCDCLMKEVNKTEVKTKELIERGLELLRYVEGGNPDGLTPVQAQAKWEQFDARRTVARKGFRSFRSIPCVEKVMKKVRDAGHDFFDYGTITQKHCLLTRVFTEMPSKP